MTPLSMFPLPLPSNGPPVGYAWEGSDISVLSTTTAFNTGVDQRDIFLGKRRCVVCGQSEGMLLQRCHVTEDSYSGQEIWSDLKKRGWIPSRAETHPRHEPRDALLMCVNHHILFDAYAFFIRFVPDVQRFVFVNYSNTPSLAKFHGKAVAIDIKNHHAPFPSLFILHEMRVRGLHPFQPINPEIVDGGQWQDWIYSDGVFDESSGSFKQDKAPNNNDVSINTQLNLMTMNQITSADSPGPGGGRRVELNEGVIADILASTCASPSWKACQMEGTSWTGTAEKNIQKYRDLCADGGVQEPSS